MPHNPQTDALGVVVVLADQFASRVPCLEFTDADGAGDVREKIFVFI